MEGFYSNSDQPSVIAQQQGSKFSFLLIIGLVSILIGFSVVILDFLGIINVFNHTKQQNVQIAQTPSSDNTQILDNSYVDSHGNLSFNCPVPKQFCIQGKVIRNGNKYVGIGFKIPVGTKIFASIPGIISFGGTENKILGISNHAVMYIGGTQTSGYTAVYEYFGLPEDNLKSTSKVNTKQELAAVWGGNFPDKNPYEGVNLLFYVQDPNQKIQEISVEDFEI